MSTLTIELSEELAARLESASLARHLPPATFAQQVLEKMLLTPEGGFPEDDTLSFDRMKDGFGCIKSGVSDLATNPEHLEGFGEWRR